MIGIACYFGTVRRSSSYWTVEDPLGTFGINFIGGLVGGLSVGFFSDEKVSGYDKSVHYHPNGAFYGNPKQVHRGI